jgi:hypothetical protein
MESVSAATIAAATAAAAGAGEGLPTLAHHPDAAVQYFKLCRTVLGVVPDALVARGALGAALQLVGPALRCRTHDVARACKNFVYPLLVGTGVPRAAATQQALDAAIVAHAGALVTGLVQGLADDNASAAANSIVEMLHACMKVYGARGLPGMLAGAIESAASVAAARAVAAAQTAPETAARFAERQAAGLPLLEDTTLLCLTPAERLGLVSAAARAAASEPAKFKLIMTDFGKLCRREAEKDALAPYLTLQP